MYSGLTETNGLVVTAAYTTGAVLANARYFIARYLTYTGLDSGDFTTLKTAIGAVTFNKVDYANYTGNKVAGNKGIVYGFFCFHRVSKDYLKENDSDEPRELN